MVLGTPVEIPVQVRTATAFMAVFSVPASPAQTLIDHTGLELLQYRPGRGVCTLVFVDYVDATSAPTTSSASASSCATTPGAAAACRRICATSRPEEPAR